MGRATKVCDCAPGENERLLKTYVYDGASLGAEQSIGGNCTLYAYDGLGRETERLSYNAIDNHADKCYSEYDDFARTVKTNVVSVNFSDNAEETVRISTKHYDESGRLIKQSEGKNLETRSFCYDNRNNLISETDGNGNTVLYEYDDMNKMVSATDADENVTRYSYDAAGNLSSVTSPGGGFESYTYDTIGRMMSYTDKLGNSEFYAYDAVGNLIGKKDRLGNVTVNTYNSRNFVTSTKIGTERVTYSYDDFDNVTEMADGTGITKYSYTFDNLLASVTYPDGRKMSYSYVPSENKIVKTDYAGEETIEYFNAGGLITSVSDEEKSMASYGFKGGLLANAAFEFGSVTYGYDKAGRITNLCNTLGDKKRGYLYEYDESGNQTKKIENVNGTELVTQYAYDRLNRLTKVTEADGTITEYRFDERGNIVEKALEHSEEYVFKCGNIGIAEVSEHTVNYTYDEANRLISETESVTGADTFSGMRTYTYDDAGNLTSKTTSGDYGAKSESYVYDAFGKLIKYIEDGEEKASYKYNGSGQRVEKTVDGVKTKYYWDGANIKNEGTASSVKVTNYFGANGVFARKTGDETNTLFKNGHGDTVLLTRGNDIVRDYDYDAYGNEKSAISGDNNPFRYSGEYQDVETGFIYLRNRYYSPSIGRFITEDPAKAGLNWYAYCEGNPVNRIDPLGLDSYVFYTNGKNSDFSSQAQWQKDRLENMGEKVIMVPVTDVKTFEDAWNGMGMVDGKIVNINYVMIYTHGNYRSMIFESGSSTQAMSINGKNSSGGEIGNINDLQEKEIKELNFLSCNAGNLLTYYNEKENLASVLSKKVINGNTYAYDGNVSFGKSPWDILKKDIGRSSRLATNQQGFNEIAKKYNVSGRKPLGKITYYNGVYKPYGYYPNTGILSN